MKKKVWIGLIIAIVIVALLAIYFSFFFHKTCSSQECFNSALLDCKKAQFLDDQQDATWQYSINGRVNQKCEVDVTLLQLKDGDVNMLELEGKSMKCYIDLGVIVGPQSNLDKCHGILKEEMQKLMIERLFKYIVDNTGEIAEELERVI